MAKDLVEKELEFLFPSEELEVAGHTFEITPFSFVETRIVAVKLQNVLHKLADGFAIENIAEIYADGYDGIRDVMAMCLNIKPETVDKFDQKSAMKVISKIIEINKDFFVGEVETEVEQLVEMLAPDNSPSEK